MSKERRKQERKKERKRKGREESGTWLTTSVCAHAEETMHTREGNAVASRPLTCGLGAEG
jgi:hypothetical protein